jgi:hypothetical protein
LFIFNKNSADNMAHLVEQIVYCSKSVQTCAEHQKCITDDVLHLSRLKSNKLSVNNAYYSPCELLDNIVRTYRAKAEHKVKNGWGKRGNNKVIEKEKEWKK